MQQHSTVSVRKYTTSDEKDWNDFVAKARNATFVFDRRYMDYHSDRFTDHSLLVFDRDKLSALFVANEDGNVVHSHGGLTYGGLVVGNDARMEEVLRYFFHVVKYYSASFASIVYKCFPAEFMRFPSQEDLYALFLLKADLIGRQSSSVFERNSGVWYRRSKRETVAKPAKQGIQYAIAKSNDPEEFWSKVLVPNLRDRFSATPVHSVDEIKLLMKRFPSNIKLFEIRDTNLLAGAVVYITGETVHTQYLSATEDGKKADALDVLIDHLVANVFEDRSRFSFGTSNEDKGRKLNRGLIAWKEGFGARTMVHDIYRIETDRYIELEEYE